MKSVEQLQHYTKLLSQKAIDKLSIVEEDAFDKFSFYLEKSIMESLRKHKIVNGIEVSTPMYPLKGIDLSLEQFIGVSCNIARRFSELGYIVFFKDRLERIYPISYYVQHPQWLNEMILIIK